MRKILLLSMFLMSCASKDIQKELRLTLKKQGYFSVKIHNYLAGDVAGGCGKYTSSLEWTAKKNKIKYKGRSCCSVGFIGTGCTKSYEIKVE